MTQLVLVGLMGAGKTTVGRRCAERLGRAFVDTDDVAEKFAMMPVPDYLSTHGEPAFRELERNAVAQVCASPESLVIACGGGTVLDPENRKQLRGVGVVVWLRAPAAVLATRVGDGRSRPLIAHDPPSALARLELLREPAYEATAHRTVDTDGLEIDEVVDAVLRSFEETAR